jgi:hypothetical protein
MLEPMKSRYAVLCLAVSSGANSSLGMQVSLSMCKENRAQTSKHVTRKSDGRKKREAMARRGRVGK